MALDRGTLAKIDRRLLSDLDHIEGVQLVKVPVSDAVWSTWRRYCDALGISMGRGIAALIHHELRTVVEEDLGKDPVFLTELEHRVAEREAALDARERNLEARERRLRAFERQIRTEPSSLRPSDWVTKVGRNDPCPCGSGFKYKRCHGA